MNEDSSLVEVLSEVEEKKWELKTLTAMHMGVCALAAQGLKRGEVSALMGITPEYVTMLLAQPLCKEYVKKLNEAVETRLEALFETSVDVIGQTLRSGSAEEKLKAARLQLEATQRLGKVTRAPEDSEGSVQRLERLAERLVNLLPSKPTEFTPFHDTPEGSYSE